MVHTPVFPVFWKYRQEDQELKVIISDVEVGGQSGLHEILSQKPNKCLQLLALSDLGCSRSWLEKLHSAVGSSWCRDSQLFDVLRTRDWVLIPTLDIYMNTHTHKGTENFTEEKVGRIQELEDGEEYYEMLSSRPDTAMALTSS